jgi:hypothetical protein
VSNYIVHPGTTEYVNSLPTGHPFHRTQTAFELESTRPDGMCIVNIYGVHIPVEPLASDIVVNISGGPRSAVLAACVIEAYRLADSHPRIHLNTFQDYYGSADTAPDIELCNKRVGSATDHIVERLCNRFKGDIKKSSQTLPRSDVHSVIAAATDVATADRLGVLLESHLLTHTVYPAGIDLVVSRTGATQVYSGNTGEQLTIEQLDSEFKIAKYITQSEVRATTEVIHRYCKYGSLKYSHHRPFEWTDQQWINSVVEHLGLEAIVNSTTTDLSSATPTGNYKDNQNV